MGNEKKKSIDELLEEALVPDEEQPYEVPENWVWVRLGDVITINMGQSPSGKYTTTQETDYPLIGGPADMGEVFPNTSRFTLKPTKLSTPGELIISVRATLGKVNVADKIYCLGRGVAGLSSMYSNTDFIKYYLISIKKGLSNIANGTTFLQISKKDIENILLPLPPLNEQKRIGKKIEHLFTKLDETKRLIEEVKKSFELRRATIIKKILEENIENGVNRGWEYKPIKDLFEITGGGTPRKSKKEYWSGDIPWISAKDMKRLYIGETEDYITSKGLNNSTTKLVPKGSIAMVVRSGILKHTLPVAYLMMDGTVNQDLKVFNSNNEMLNKYFLWYVKGNDKSLLSKYSKSGTTVNSIDFQKFKEHIIPIPPFYEMENKISRIESLFQKNNAVQGTIQLLDPETLKQSILHKAFRGKLDTNNPSDESAIDLLKDALQH